MRISLLVATALLAVALAGPDARASNCAVDQYTHNKSLMEIYFCDEGVNIAYLRPRAGLKKHGVREGTILFEGTWGPGDDEIIGTARVFSKRCGVAAYPVAGRQHGQVVQLYGSAPVRNKNCEVVRHRKDNLDFQLVTENNPGGSAGSGSGDWYAIAGTFTSRAEAQRRARRLGGDTWAAMNTSNCPNFTNGFWIAAAGPMSQGQAQAFANAASGYGAYAKSCN